MNGAVEGPNPDFIEWALSGYTGEYAAPSAKSDLHLNKVTEAIKSFFTEPMEWSIVHLTLSR